MYAREYRRIEGKYEGNSSNSVVIAKSAIESIGILPRQSQMLKIMSYR
jgi:hypothetical protein